MTSVGAGTEWTGATRGAGDLHGSITALQPGSLLAGRYEILELLRRFKQELILARGITPKNVIRIFDVGAAEGLKFITMELVEGRPLSNLLAERSKLPPEEAAAILRQICLGLEAAHAEGVVHRDLKPQNVMLDVHGKVTVMDFGIARSTEVAGTTRTGALLGTPAYMSPEQTKGEHVDSRPDLFSPGTILYEALTGVRPFEAETMMGTPMSRVQGNLRPPIELDPAIPRPLNDIVRMCLAVDPDERYQTAAQVREDVETWQQTLPGAEPTRARRRAQPFSPLWSRLTVGVAVIALVLAGLPYRQWSAQRSPPVPRTATNAVISGSIERRGPGYAVPVRLVDAVTGKLLAGKEVEIPSKEGVLAAVGKLAAPIRKTLGEATPESAQLAAAHVYAEAQQLGGRSRWDEAVQGYLRAIELEPNLWRAYAGIVVAYANLGQRQDAERYYQQAMARLDRMTEREKYRTRGGYYLMVRSHQKAIEELSTLVSQYPADSAGLTNLSLACFYRRDMQRA